MVLIRQRERAQLTRNGLLLAVFLATVVLLDNGKSLTGAVKMTDEDRLLEELFKRRHYNPDTRPAERANDVVAVEFEITPKQLTEIDSLNEVMRILIGIDMRWTDFRLAWNESDYGGLSLISIPFSKLWRPDIILTNSAEEWKKPAEMNVVISSDGSCRWFPTMMAVSYCSIDIQWFPFDKQTCLLDFGSSSYNVSELNITSKREKRISDLHMKSSEWDLIEYSSIDSTVLHDGGFLSSSHVIFTFRWRRLTLYYGVIMILPCTMLFLISVVTYLIPPEMGDRISLAITTLLAMGVHQMMVSESVPPTSDVTPLIGAYFTCMMTTNAVSLMAMIFIYNLCHRSPTKPHPSTRFKYHVKRIDKLLLLGTDLIHCRLRRRSKPPTHSSVVEPKKNNEASQGQSNTEIDPLIRRLTNQSEENIQVDDHSSGAEPSETKAAGEGTTSTESIALNIIQGHRPVAKSKQSPEIVVISVEDPSNTVSEGKAITGDRIQREPSIHSIAKGKQSLMSEGTNVVDWKYVALVIDRLCFVIYISCLTIYTVVFGIIASVV